MSVQTAALKQFRWPQLAISRFVTRRTVRSATFWALIFGLFVAAKATTYASSYPTVRARAELAASFGNNIGLNILLGLPHKLDTVLGFTAWNTLIVMAVIGGIWAYLLATKTFRGEEEAGRYEILLSGQTTGRRAATNTLVGLGTSLVAMYVVAAVTFVLVGRVHNVSFTTGAGLFFALCVVAGAAIFMAVGALASQLMPTRSRAAALSTAIFGISFLLRAAADTTSAHWLLDITPLGWIERLRPLYDSQPQWLVPIGALILLLCAIAIFVAGRRDLGASIFADKDSARPKTKLLGRPLALAFRLNRATTISWLAAAGLTALFYGFMTKPAAQAFSSSKRLENALSRLTHTAQVAGAKIFLGIVFFLLMTLMMSYVASAAGKMREDEAKGYLDNLLVRHVGRLQWLFGRIFLIVITAILAGLLSGLAVWAGEASQGQGVLFGSILLAGINCVAPALFTLGIAMFIFGFLPRLTTVMAYGVIAWSFLLEMLSSGLNLSHWVLDTSILHHIQLAPVTNPDWHTNWIILGLSVILMALGMLRFNNRDLQNE
ncbi:MAG: ABC transporter permease subunit [Candidatus Saccharimonadales bacterium]|jgi:ABC-2 type transport system permease protein